MGSRDFIAKRTADGAICRGCREKLPTTDGKPSYCVRCSDPSRKHRVHMRYEWTGRIWQVSFQAEGPALRLLNFGSEAKIEELALRGHGLKSLADKQAFDMGLSQGKGGLELRLTEGQLAALRR